MINSLLIKKLTSRFLEQKLANFYILKASTTQSEDLTTFTHELLTSFVQAAYECSVEKAKERLTWGEVDIVTLNPSKESGRYTVDDFSTLFSFVGYKRNNLPQKIAIIHAGQEISIPIFNKLLKILEEPANNCSIFLLYPSETKLLSTIESRAISLYPILKTGHLSEVTPSNRPNYLTSKVTLCDLLEQLKKDKNSAKESLQHSLRSINPKELTFYEMTQLQNSISHLERSATLNLPIGHLLFALLRDFEKHLKA